MQNLENTQLPKTQDNEKITNTEKSKDLKNINPDKIQPLHKWLLSENTMITFLYIIAIIHTYGRIKTWTIEKQVQEQIRQSKIYNFNLSLKTLKIQENKKEEL